MRKVGWPVGLSPSVGYGIAAEFPLTKTGHKPSRWRRIVDPETRLQSGRVGKIRSMSQAPAATWGGFSGEQGRAGKRFLGKVLLGVCICTALQPVQDASLMRHRERERERRKEWVGIKVPYNYDGFSSRDICVG